MKKCLQCEQVYGDETNFCLSDGSTLVSVSDPFASQTETPTVFSGGQFVPPTSYSVPTAAAETKKSNTLLIALVIGFFALVVGGAIIGLAIYGLSSSSKKDTNAANISKPANQINKNTVAEQKSDNDNLAQSLKQQQDKLDKEKQKLEDERKALEAKKKEAAQTPPPSNATTATITDPPTNIRANPNGAIICVMRQRGTIVNILGSTGISDNNGTWYYTDACGKQGVIHSSQIRF